MSRSDLQAEDAALAEALIATVIAAGAAAMDVYHQDFAVDRKSDASPVTEADRRAEEIILAGLSALAPEIPVIAEEACSEGHVPSVAKAFFLVDPVDGTREFISRNGDFTVNVALIRDGGPVFGLVYAPAHGLMFIGRPGGAERLTIHDGAVAAREPIAAEIQPDAAPRIIASRSHRTAETDAYIAAHPGASIVSAGSSLKFCLMAAGEADLYPRLGPTMQWDTAAGDAVLRAAGGVVTNMDGTPLTYGPKGGSGAMGFANPWFVAHGARPDADPDDKHD